MFELNSKFKPMGDQPSAIKELVNGIRSNRYRENIYNSKCYKRS